MRSFDKLAVLLLTALLSAGPALAESAAPASQRPAPPVARGAAEGAEAMRLAIGRCWNVASLSPEALQVQVTVGVDLDADGRPLADSVHLIWPKGDDDMDAQHMYETARRAILRCGKDGLPLPADRQGVAQRLELTFNATGTVR